MHTLIESFNPNAADQVMCKNTISVRWDGNLYDCDFNQMLNLQINSPHNHIANFNLEKLSQRSITISQHCMAVQQELEVAVRFNNLINGYKKELIIVFVRNPELGKVKTRLAHSIGNQKALDVYKCLLKHTHNVLSNCNYS